MNRIKHICNAKNLHKGHTREPFIRQNQLNNRFCTKCKAHHQRSHDVGTGFNCSPCHSFHLDRIILCAGHSRQKYAVNWWVNIVDDHIWEFICLIVVSKISRGIHLADNQTAQIVVHCVQQCWSQKLPPKGKQSLQTLPWKHFLGTPFYCQPQNQRVNGRIRQLLHHNSPYTKTSISQPNAQECRENRSSQRCKEEPLEQHIPRHIRLLDSLHARDYDGQADNPYQWSQCRIIVKRRNKRCCHKHNSI